MRLSPHIDLTCVKKKVVSTEKKSFSLRIRKMGGILVAQSHNAAESLATHGFCDVQLLCKFKNEGGTVAQKGESE